MADNPFNAGMNDGNDRFAADCHEDFEVLRGGKTGTVTAVSIDDLGFETLLSQGGQVLDAQVNIYINSAVRAAAGINEGAVLKVRGRNVRVARVSVDGDNNDTLMCESAGVKL